MRIDVHDYVRREQGRFFRAGRYNRTEAATLIAAEALLGGASAVSVRSVDEWMAVCADADWLEGIEDRAFTSLLSLPAAGPNGCTSELLLAVFAADVMTETRSSRTRIKGSARSPFGELGSEWARAVYFRNED